MRAKEFYAEVESDDHLKLPSQVMKKLNISTGSKLRVIIENSEVIILEKMDEGMLSEAKRYVEHFKKRVERYPPIQEHAECIEGLTVREYFELSDEEQKKLWDRLYREALEA